MKIIFADGNIDHINYNMNVYFTIIHKFGKGKLCKDI